MSQVTVRLRIATAEFSFLIAALAMMPLPRPYVALLLILTFALLGLFALITGWGLPRLRGRLSHSQQALCDKLLPRGNDP